MTPADLKAWRAARGITLEEAADLLGVSLRWYAYAEAGRNAHGRETEGVPPRIELAVLKLGGGTET